MIDDFVVESVTRVSNARIKKLYPLLEKHFSTAEVKIVCEAMYEICKKILEKEEKLENNIC